MKQLLLGTVFGRLALAARNALELIRALRSSPETVGMLLNDQLSVFLLARLCRSSKVFIDVGAHIGSVVSEVSEHDSSIEIIAIEAMPEKASRLRHKFPKIKLHECAAAESEGEASFFINTRYSGYSSLGRPTANAMPDVVEIKVRLKTLDSIISSKNIDAVKIDVEGGELGVLRGSDRLIADNRPVIMFESGPAVDDDGLGYTKESLWQWLNEHQFEVFVPNRVAHNGPGLSLEGFLESHFFPRRTTNYFAIPNERRIEIRDRARNVLGISQGD